MLPYMLLTPCKLWESLHPRCVDCSLTHNPYTLTNYLHHCIVCLLSIMHINLTRNLQGLQSSYKAQYVVFVQHRCWHASNVMTYPYRKLTGKITLLITGLRSVVRIHIYVKNRVRPLVRNKYNIINYLATH
jgi:hypothetical protein